MPRFFIDVPLASGQALALPEDIVRHVQVLRLAPGDALTLFNGAGGEYAATLDSLGKKQALAVVGAHATREAEPPYQVILAQGIAGGDKMDWLIEKAVELGAAGIVPLLTGRGVVRLAPERAVRRHAHWTALVRAACAQCGRNRVPEIAPPQGLDTWLAQQGETGPDVAGALRLMLSPRAGTALRALPAAPPDVPVVVLIGPEGGLSEEEESQACAAGFMPLGLGPRVLRTETAGLAVLAALAARWGGF